MHGFVSKYPFSAILVKNGYFKGYYLKAITVYIAFKFEKYLTIISYKIVIFGHFLSKNRYTWYHLNANYIRISHQMKMKNRCWHTLGQYSRNGTSVSAKVCKNSGGHRFDAVKKCYSSNVS